MSRIQSYLHVLSWTYLVHARNKHAVAMHAEDHTILFVALETLCFTKTLCTPIIV